MLFLTTFLSAVLLTVMAVPIFSRMALRYGLVDMPDERKVHTRPIPRIGGLAMALGVFAPTIYWFEGDRLVMSYLAGAGVLLLFGLADDFRDLRPRWKLLGQVIAALIVIFYGGVIFQVRADLPSTVMADYPFQTPIGRMSSRIQPPGF
jgi:UDP-GlcNAc:undecaprenyl-phosphate GlcNAc-1-phosphate transferase